MLDVCLLINILNTGNRLINAKGIGRHRAIPPADDDMSVRLGGHGSLPSGWIHLLRSIEFPPSYDNISIKIRCPDLYDLPVHDLIYHRLYPAYQTIIYRRVANLPPASTRGQE